MVVGYLCGGLLAALLLTQLLLHFVFNLRDLTTVLVSGLCCLSFISTVAYVLTEEVSPWYLMVAVVLAAIVPGLYGIWADTYRNGHNLFVALWFKEMMPGGHIRWLTYDGGGMLKHVSSKSSNLSVILPLDARGGDDLACTTFCHFMSMLAFYLAQLLVYVGFAVWMAVLSLLWLPTLAVGCLLHQTNLMCVTRVRNTWVQKWTGGTNPLTGEFDGKIMLRGLAASGWQAGTVIIVRVLNSTVLWNSWSIYYVTTGAILVVITVSAAIASVLLYVTRTVDLDEEKKTLLRGKDIIDFLNDEDDDPTVGSDNVEAGSSPPLVERYIKTPADYLYYLLQVRSKTDLQIQRLMIAYNVHTPNDLHYTNRKTILVILESVRGKKDADKALRKYCREIVGCIEFVGKPSLSARLMKCLGVELLLEKLLKPLVDSLFVDKTHSVVTTNSMQQQATTTQAISMDITTTEQQAHDVGNDDSHAAVAEVKEQEAEEETEIAKEGKVVEMAVVRHRSKQLTTQRI